VNKWVKKKLAVERMVANTTGRGGSSEGKGGQNAEFGTG